VLDADVEVDRGDFTVRAAVRVEPGERLALFGPSGAGKTTVLEAIAGLAPLSRGRVVLHGRVLTSTTPARALPPWQRRVGLLRQDPGLFPHLSVRDNLGYAKAASGRGSELAALAGLLEIGGLLSAMPARLSGGQQHRVALGRLLLADCDALLLDEPYSGLDAALRRSLTDLVVRLTGDRQVPAIMVAHELPDAQAFASRLAVLDGYLGFVPAGTGRDAGAAGTVAGVHPDRVIAGAHPDRGVVVTGTMTGCRPSGAGWEADLRAGEPVIVCRLPEQPAVSGGQLVVTALDPPLFGPDGAALPGPAPAVACHRTDS
jgi:molybdate transport system ATP-binding protein